MLKTKLNSFSMIMGVFFLGILILKPNSSQATHAAGADITYQCLGNNQYRITVAFYRDCFGIAESSSYGLTIVSAKKNVSLSATATKISGPNGIIVTPVCQTAVSKCNGGTALGIRKWIYQATITLPSQSDDWVVGFRECNRNSSITTVNNPDLTCQYVEAKINNQNGVCNSSPTFSVDPIGYACIAQNFSYNQGAFDADGDSLFFELINPLDDEGVNIPFISPYTATSPMSTSTPFTFNSVTGALNFTPNLLQVGILTSRVKEYRNGVFIGSCMRDFQFNVGSCGNNDVPSASGVNGGSNFGVSICPGDNICFDITSSDNDVNQIVTMTSNATTVIPGSTFTTNGANRPTGTFCWQTTAGDASANPYVFSVTVIDDACPNGAAQTFTYSVNVKEIDFTLNSTPTSCLGNTGSATATINDPNGGNGYSFEWSNGSTNSNISALASGTYTVTVTSAGGCTKSGSVVVSNQGGNISCTATSTPSNSCNGNCTGTATATVTGTGNISYSWLTTPVQTTQTATGLCPGLYTVNVNDAAGCSSSCSVLVTGGGQGGSITCTIIGNNNAACDKSCNGSATVSVTGGSNNYSYTWSTSPAQTNATATGLCSGDYNVAVTDNLSGCTTTCTVKIDDAGAGLNCSVVLLKTVSCYGFNDGVLRANVAGGNAPYTYLWSNGVTTQVISGLGKGTYTVTVTSNNGCTSVCKKYLGQPSQLTCSANTKDATCTKKCNGEAAIIVTGGKPPYIYNWGNGASNVDVKSDLCPGAYTVGVTDSRGCICEVKFDIKDNSAKCDKFLTGHNQTYYNPKPGGNVVSNYLTNNFSAVFPNGLSIGGGCNNSKSILITSASAAKIIMQGTGAPATLTTNYTNPSLATLNNSLASQLTGLSLNIAFDEFDANWAPSSSVHFNQMVLDSGPLKGITVAQLQTEASKALGGCGSIYSNSILRTYCALVNSSWNLGVKSNGLLTCPKDPCDSKLSFIALDANDELQFGMFPNPANDNVNVHFVSLGEYEFVVEMLDITGRVVSTNSGVSQTGLNSLAYSISSISKGTYLVRFRMNGDTRVARVMVN